MEVACWHGKARTSSRPWDPAPHHSVPKHRDRQDTFFCDEDYQTYLDLMAEWCGERGVDIWAAFAVHSGARLRLQGTLAMLRAPA